MKTSAAINLHLSFVSCSVSRDLIEQFSTELDLLTENGQCIGTPMWTWPLFWLLLPQFVPMANHHEWRFACNHNFWQLICFEDFNYFFLNTFPGEAPDGTKYKTAYRCEGEDLRISCDPGETIQVVRANYGRFSIAICNKNGYTDWSVNCMSHTTTRILQRK